MNVGWAAVADALNRAEAEGRTIRVWLRDDDAVAVTRPLEQLRDLCASVGLPVLLAVIPANAQDSLGPWVAAHSSFTPCQHGYAHIDHAGPDTRACELGGARPHAAVLDELRRGRHRLQVLFGPRLSDLLVPPWNRIDPALIPLLPPLGFDALSTFGPPPTRPSEIRHVNSDLDIMDWRGGRVGRSFEDLCGKLSSLAEQSRETGRPIGILTHHLAHDVQAWAALARLLERLGAHPAARFTSAAELQRA